MEGIVAFDFVAQLDGSYPMEYWSHNYKTAASSDAVLHKIERVWFSILWLAADPLPHKTHYKDSTICGGRAPGGLAALTTTELLPG